MKKNIFITALLSSVLSISAFAQEDEGWKLHTALSYVKVSGNTETETFGARAEATKNAGLNRYDLKGEFLYGKADGKENTNLFSLLGRWERLISERLFGFAQADYIHNKFSGYDYRSTFGAGLGYDILKTPKHYLKGMFSLGYTLEDLKVGGTNDYASGKLEAYYTWKIRENLRLKEDASYLQSFKELTVYYITSITSLEVKISDNVSLGLGYRFAYQHRPPANYEKTDTTFLTSLIIDY